VLESEGAESCHWHKEMNLVLIGERRRGIINYVNGCVLESEGAESYH
jgi:hypothetical protein